MAYAMPEWHQEYGRFMELTLIRVHVKYFLSCIHISGSSQEVIHKMMRSSMRQFFSRRMMKSSVMILIQSTHFFLSVAHRQTDL